MVSSGDHPREPKNPVATARLFEIFLDMPFKDRRLLLKESKTQHSQAEENNEQENIGRR